MADSNQPAAAAAAAAATIESPVTWHVAFWILACLGISCMSQPRHKFCSVGAEYKLYLISSPFLCATDAICTNIRALVAAWYLKGDLCAASRFAVNHRSKQDKDEKAEPYADVSKEVPKYDTEHVTAHVTEHVAGHDTEHLEETNDHTESASWPRIMLFIVGTAPAFVKLIALEGIQWTKVWGTLYAASFVTTELYTAISHIKKPTSAGNVQTQMLLRLRSKLDLFDRSLIICVLIGHILFLAYLVQGMWGKVIDILSAPAVAPPLNYAIGYIREILNAILLVYVLFFAGCYLLRGLSKARLKRMWELFELLVLARLQLVPLTPVGSVSDLLTYSPPQWLQNIDSFWDTNAARGIINASNWLRVAMMVAAIGYVVVAIALFVIKCLPPGRSFPNKFKPAGNMFFLAIVLPDRPVSLSSHDIEKPSSNAILSEPATLRSWHCYWIIWIYVFFAVIVISEAFPALCRRWPVVARILLVSPNEEKSVKESNTDATSVNLTDEHSSKTATDQVGCLALLLFFLNLITCVLWYAFKYDQTATYNPAWTDIFG